MIRPLLLLSILGLLAIPLNALTIHLVNETDWDVASQPPEDDGDNGGDKLMAIADAAAAYWSNIIEDPHVLDITIRYDNSITPVSTKARARTTAEAGGRPTEGLIRFRRPTQGRLQRPRCRPRRHLENHQRRIRHRLVPPPHHQRTPRRQALPHV